MKKNPFVSHLLWHFSKKGKSKTLLIVSASALALASCSEGADCDERFNGGVNNTQLENPAAQNVKFSTVVNSDGSENVLCEWPTVYGASGFETEVFNVDDPANPIIVSEKDTIDGNSFTFKKAEDTNYQVNIRVLGNITYNNKDAAEATRIAYSSMIPAQIIPAGTEISSFIASHIVETGDEQAFELESGEYECNSEIDFQDKKVTLRGNKVNHSVVKFGKDGVIRTSAGMKVKWINFDCAEQGNKGGVIEMSVNPPASASAEAQGIAAGKNSNKPADVYVLMAPIIIQDCAFKDVNVALFSVGECSWGIADLRIDNCVVQLKNDGSQWSDGSVLSGYSKGFKAPSGGQFWYGGIKSITVKNSTFVNTVENKKNNRFIRFNNKDLDRVFPTPDGSATFENNTFYKTFANKEFGNNTPNRKEYTITFNNNICYDIFRLQKFIQGNCTNVVNQATNSICGVSNKVDATDKSKWATEEPDMSFAGPCEQSLDFSKPSFGVNFKATSALSSTIGDPRWRE